MYNGYPPVNSADHASLSGLGLTTGSEADDPTLYYDREPHSVSPPPPPSRWVSSMAKAANDPIDSTEEHDELSQWSPLSIQMPLPPHPPPTLPPPPYTTNAPNNLTRSNISSLPKPVEHHALPPKPPPSQPIQTTIGMKPDQDPNSKHGIFQLSSATKEAGTDIKKGPLYMPNPARTLVMEQLPKSHRHPDFINKWSKSACGAHPVHMFIDGPGGKALIEFATAELARKAWASPKLGPVHAHQVKGKPREDLIKVWWYRVNGVGAGSGVGEIEEGEIEGDVIEKESDQPFRKETKKEKKARLAKEREEKKAKRELELKLIKEQHGSLQQLQVGLPTSSTSSFVVPEISSQRALMPVLWPSIPTPGSSPWLPAQAPAQHLPISSDANSWVEWGRPLPNWGPSTWATGSRADNLDDYESNMEIDEPQLPPLTYSAVRHVQNAPPLHNSLPPRPTSNISAPLPRVGAQRPPSPPLPPPSPPAPSPPININLAIPSPRPVYKAPPQVSPLLPLPPQTMLPSRSSSPSSTPPPTSLPSEPRAMKNAPTEPSFTKRALMARHKELQERIAQSKLELAAGFTRKPETPVTSLQPADSPIPAKPSMDLGEKQAMEDRLRKLVLQSQKAKGKAGPTTSSADNSNGTSNVLATTPSDVPSISQSISTSSSSSSLSSAPSSIVSSNQLPPAQSMTVSLSAQDFSLEDLAVSFITQTIETIKSQSAPTPTQTPTIYPSNKLVSTTATQLNNNSMKLELAAKQRRLEQHITESKILMTKLAQARTKEEKDTILKAMREMTRCVSISPISSDNIILVILSGVINWTK